ncbi:hypothetical protein CF326_g1617 [Tilletia indica]|nr:hypothetical protein CF326_g1617 [Tilletia indica]
MADPTLPSSTICVDGTSFGPSSECRGFDFSTLFENTLLVLVPNLLFIGLFLIIRLPHLLRKTRIRPPVQPSNPKQRALATLGLPWTTYVPSSPGDFRILDRPIDANTLPIRSDWLGLARILFALVGVILAAVLLGLGQTELAKDPDTYAALGGWSFTMAQSLQLIGAITLAVAVWAERLYTRGGSFLVPFFILSSILFDGARLRTLNMIDIPIGNGPFVQHSLRITSFFRVLAASLGIKVILLVTESVNTDSGETDEARATWFNRLGFFWLFPLMSTGVRRALQMDDLPQLDSSYSTAHLSHYFTATWNFSEQAKRKKQGKRTESFLRSIVKAFPYVAYGPILSKLVITAITLAQPYLISNVIRFVESWGLQSAGGPPAQPVALGWALAGAFALCYSVNALGQGVFYWIATQNGVTLRGLLIGQLYAKSLRIHMAETGTLGSAGAVNLMSADVERIISAVHPFHELWSGIVTIAIGLYILYTVIGALFVVPLVVTLLLLCGGSLGINLGKWQKEWSERTEQRLAVTSSMVNNMKAVKMSGLEAFFQRKLTGLREAEMNSLSKYLMTLANVVFVANIGQGTLLVSTFAALAITVRVHPNFSHPFDQNTVFTALSALNVVTFPVLMLGQNFAMSFMAAASFKRVESFLLMDEKEADADFKYDEADKSSEHSDDPKSSGKSVIKCEDATMQWDLKGDAVLQDVTIDFRTGITMVIGPLSSGKSTLLSAVLAEPYITSGKVITPAQNSVRKPIAYSSQDCWIQETLSIRANIIFHSDQRVDQGWYDTVVAACCLNEDFATFALGDKRLAKSLSGGQRQRISLARAVYAREADLVVLDDPFCALDGETEARTWANLFQHPTGLLRNKTVVLASNALHRLKDVDWIVRLGDGKVLQQGPPAQVKLSEEEIRDLETAQKAVSEAIKKGKKVKAGNDKDEDADGDEDTEMTVKVDSNFELDKDGNVIEEVGVGRILYKYYGFWLKCASPMRFGVMLVCFILANAGTWGMQGYLQRWTLRSDQSKQENFGALLGGLFALLAVYLMFEGIDIYLAIGIISPRAGRKLHRRLLQGVLSAPLAFFESRSSGQILNRFSQDLMAADSQWMMFLAAFLACLLGVIILMVISAPYLLIVVAVVAVAVFLIRCYYLPNSRQLRRLEMSSKSPLYTLFGDSTTGLAVIRAFGRQKTLSDMCRTYTDTSQRPHYALEACRRWLLVYTNLCAMVTNSALVLIVVGIRSSRTASVVGVALAQTVNLSVMLTAVITTWCEAEIAGVVFERLYEFSHTPSEEVGSNGKIPSSFEDGKDEEKYSPASAIRGKPGTVDFKDVVLSYTSGEGEPVLKSLSFSLNPGEHLGICGRTGSGKSTILLALLRMVERQSGEIRLGGQSIDSYELHQLRQAVAVVGQDPLIVNGASVRQNLTLEGELPEDRIWQVLKDVRLAEYVKALPEGLDTILDHKKARLSQGRRQLLAIARVLLNPKQVVVLDEVSSAIDEETDELIQGLLRTELQSSTVISIAHRTAAILNFDRVMVLGGGKILEMDTPSALLARPNSAFRALAKHQGVV